MYPTRMKTIADPANSLVPRPRRDPHAFQVPEGFPPAVLAAADAAARRAPTEHADRTDRHFVTLDPASATDLDQAFAIELSGTDLLLHYAIADVAWFVADGDALDTEAWHRGTTLYLPDGKAGLYPSILSEGAASLLPDGPRPAVVFTVRVAPDGAVRLDGTERAIIRSNAKLAYDSVRDPISRPVSRNSLRVSSKPRPAAAPPASIRPSRKSPRARMAASNWCSARASSRRNATPRCRSRPIWRSRTCSPRIGPACSA